MVILLLLTGGCSQRLQVQGQDQQTVAPSAATETTETQRATPSTALVATLPEPPDSLNPRQAANRSALRLLNAISEGLVRMGADGRISVGSGLAENLNIDASRTQYTFTLRDTSWSDGTPLTADDFVRAWREAVDPRNQSPHARLFFPIKNAETIFNLTDESQLEQRLPELGVQAIDSRTLQITLEEPYEPFVRQLVLPAFFPAPPQAHDRDPLPAIGPFRFSTIPNAQGYELVRNEHYWDSGSVRLDKLSFRLTASWRERLDRFEEGKIQWMDLPLSAVQTFKDKDWIRSESQGVVWYLVFNTARQPFQDVRLRKALSLAVDRLQLSQATLQQGAVPATGLTPPGILTPLGESFAGQINLLPERAELEQAKNLWSSAEGAPKSISLVGAEEVKPLLETIAQMWEKNLGLSVEVLAENTESRVNRAISGDFQVMVDYWVADYNDPLTFLRLMVTDGLFNDSGWGKSQFDQLVDKGRSEADPSKRHQAMLQAEELLLAMDGSDNLPIAPLCWPVFYYAVNPQLRGAIYSPVGSDVEFKYAYFVEP